MKLRADHVSGFFFVAVGVFVVALSGDLPVGRTSMPGAGFMPMLIAALLVILGIALFLRGREGRTFSELDWDDGSHAARVLAIAVGAVALYTILGFIITMILMMMALLLIIERRNIVRAGFYSTGVVLATYFVFTRILQSQLPDGVLGP